MKFCKKILAVLLTAALIFSVCSFSLAETRTPDVPEGYDGVVVMSVEVLPLGLDFIIPPTYVPYNEGETVAEISVRLFEEYGLSYSGGDIESFYLTALEYPNMNMLEIDVPDYLMEQLIENYCYDEEDGWDQAEPTNNMLCAGNYTYYSGWMIADNDELTPVGAGEVIVEEGHVYRWMYSIYGYGMDLGMSDGWGMFPPFENPAEGVMRSEAYTLLADVLCDDDLLAQIGAGCPAHEEYVAFADAICYQGSTQEEIDAAYDAFYAALDFGGGEVIPGDVDGNGVVDATDAVLVLRIAMHIIESDNPAADFDGNGTVDVTDALLTLRTAMGING